MATKIRKVAVKTEAQKVHELATRIRGVDSRCARRGSRRYRPA